MKKMLFILLIILAVLIVLWQFRPIKEARLTENTAIQIASSITVLRPSFMSYSDIQKVLRGTGLAGYETAFLKAEEQSGIGADYLIAIAAHESGYGTNTWWKYWNNCFSWGITDKFLYLLAHCLD